MKIERMLCGMQTVDGKILSKYSKGVLDILQPKSRDRIKALQSKDTESCLWFKTEQVIAYSVIIDVYCKDPSQGGRTWVQNQTFLVNIHEFIPYVQSGKNPFDVFKLLVQPEYDKFPDIFDALQV
jgi:hypothetical protein